LPVVKQRFLVFERGMECEQHGEKHWLLLAQTRTKTKALVDVPDQLPVERTFALLLICSVVAQVHQ
jgi:hypothetical protein